MPETAAGRTTRVAVVTRRAPRPYEASRSDWGTALMASSEIVATSGIVRIPTAIAAAARLKPFAVGTSVWTIVGVDERQGEEAEDDAGDAGQDLEDRLDRAARARAGVLGQVDRRQRCRSAPAMSIAIAGHDAACRRRASRCRTCPRRGNQPGATSCDRSILTQELDRLLEDGEDDEGGDDDRDERGGEEQPPDPRLAGAAARGCRPARSAAWRVRSSMRALPRAESSEMQRRRPGLRADPAGVAPEESC